jgi:formylglycine-generating enzyme required for sulfatase activity
VWEWCADWYSPGYAASGPPARGAERVMRGGSWLCSENYCAGYRVAARMHSTPDSGLNNVGFRCVRDAP